MPGNGFFDNFLAGKQARMQEDAYAQDRQYQAEDRAMRQQQMQMQQQQAQQTQRAAVGQLVYKGAQAIASAPPQQRPVLYAAIRSELSRHPDAQEWVSHLPEMYDEAQVMPVVQQVMAQTGLYAEPPKDTRTNEIQTLEYLAQHPELAQLDQQRQWARAQMGPAASAMYRAPPQVSYGAPTTVIGPDGKPTLVRPTSDGGMVPVQGYAPPPTKGQQLPGSVVEKLAGQADVGTNLVDLAGSFKDPYAGNAITGGLENVLGRLGGENIGVATEGQADWWQQYDRQKNEVRNKLFGSALTPSEQAAFEAADINPRMDPKRIRANLATQDKIVRRGLQRRAEVWRQQGYDPEAINAATAVPAFPGSEPAAPAPAAGGRQVGDRARNAQGVVIEWNGQTWVRVQ